MQIIGITGRSGCGKSTLTDSIRTAGFRCVDADQVAREVLLPGSPCIVQLQQEFGADIVDEAGQVRRRLLADRAFATPQGTARLTAITQPEIYHRLDLAMAEARQAGEKLFFVDGAVIVGTPFQKRCSHLVLVAAPYETSVQRICARDGIAPEMARRRLDAQLPENVLRAAADFVIENDGTLQRLSRQWKMDETFFKILKMRFSSCFLEILQRFLQFCTHHLQVCRFHLHRYICCSSTF